MAQAVFDAPEKARLLGAAAVFDASASSYSEQKPCSAAAQAKAGLPLAEALCPSFMPGGQPTMLFKVLLSNACKKNCLFCAWRSERRCQRTSLQPEELAKTFMDLQDRKVVGGLFLSSAVFDSADRTMGELVKTAEIVRQKYHYKGYLHLTLIPGASRDLIAEAVRLADRASLNIETPGEKYLKKIAPDKNYQKDIYERLAWVAAEAKKKNVLPAGLTTQLVVGAAGESDKEIMESVVWLYKNVDLVRAYYGAFQPVKDTPLEALPAVSPLRENRLYQADWLLRLYKFEPQELPFDDKGNLPIGIDPKLAWARSNPANFPKEINKSSYSELLRVPGIGPISAKRIIQQRKIALIKRVEELTYLGVITKRARDFVTLAGKFYPTPKPGPKYEQLSLGIL